MRGTRPDATDELPPDGGVAFGSPRVRRLASVHSTMCVLIGWSPGSWVGLLGARGSFGARCRGPGWIESNGYFVLRPVVIDTADPEPHQAKLRAGCCGPYIDVWSLGLDLL